MNGWPDASALLGWMFVATFVGVALWETLSPSRGPVSSLSLRWFGNIVLFALVSLIGWLLPFLTSYGAAVIAARHGWGLFHLVPLPPLTALFSSVVMLDLFGYWTHRVMHKIPLLWRFHALHHSDSDLDVTTTVRHHPVEVLVETTLAAAFVLLFGFPPQAVVLYGGVVLVVQTFHHGNVTMPPRLRWLSHWLFTPDLHRLHHSMAYAENNSNFGNLVPLWDRLFGTLRRTPEGEFQVGLAEFSGPDFQRLDRLLIQPLKVNAAPPRPGT